jgi:hypothetical protein
VLEGSWTHLFLSLNATPVVLVDVGRSLASASSKSTRSSSKKKECVDCERASGSASDSNAKGSGFEPRQGQGFLSLYETPELLGAGDSHVLRMRR